MKRRLLNPGPVTLSDRVRDALATGPDLCHREDRYAKLEAGVRHRLTEVYGLADSYSTTLITGSGTAAVESMVTSLVPTDGNPVVAVNGVYGARIVAMFEAAGLKHRRVESGWLEPIDFPAVAGALAEAPASHVVAVHHETTTGRLNDISQLAQVASGTPLLLDAVSSFGGEEIDFQRWNIEAAAATANKCLHGIPGLGFVVAAEASLSSRRGPVRSVYLDLYRNHEAQVAGSPQFTPAVQTLVALEAALDEFIEGGGWEGRRGRYRRLNGVFRKALAELGAPPLLPDGDASAVLSAYSLPEGLSFETLFSRLEAAGFVIYPGQRELYQTIFRIAVMGDITDQDAQEFIAEFADAVR